MRRTVEHLRRFGALGRAVLRARRRAFDPFKLTWILTERCSLHCRTCHLWATAPADGPDLATIRAVVAANPQITWLNPSGGDLFERPDAPQVVDALVNGFPDLALFDVPTAGQDADAVLAALQPALDSDIPRVYVTVSLDGPDDVHDRVRASAGSAARARDTLRRLQAVRRRGFRAVAGMTLSRHNLPDDGVPLAEDVPALLPEGVAPGDLHLNLAHTSEHYYRNQDDPRPPADAAQAVVRAVHARQPGRPTPLAFMERRYWRHAETYLRDGRLQRVCGALRASVFVGADLRVYPCSIYDRPLGHLADVGYALRRVPEFADALPAQHAVEHQDCPGCWSPCEAFPSLLLGTGHAP